MGKNTEQKTSTEEIQVRPAEAPKNHDEEKVDIFIERAVGNDDPNLFVSVNGVNYLLPKGKTSNVPRVVAEEIRRSQRAAEKQDKNIDALLEASK